MRIQTRMMLFVTLLLTVIISSALFRLALQRRALIVRNFDARTDAMLDGVARIARESLVSRDDVMLLSYLKHLMKDSPDFELAVVTKPGYSSVLGEVATPLYYRTVSAAADDIPGVGSAQVQIQVGLSKGALERRIRSETIAMLRSMTWIALAGLLLGIAGAWWISRTLTLPIVRLAARMGGFVGRKAGEPSQSTGDEIAYLSRQFDEMSAKIHEDMQLKDELLTTLTHELNNPLAGLKGLLGLLSSNAAVDRETSETYRTMTEAVAVMELSLSNALHLLRDQAAPQVRRERLHLNDLVGQVARLFRPVAQSNRIRLQEQVSSAPIYLSGDDELVRRIVVNLVSNACKYTQPGGTVTLTLREEDGRAVISVSDTGPGIAPKDRELIFTRFYRCPGPDGKPQRIPGSGLGLAIAKRAADLHDATISLESEPGKGSTFSVLFPKEAAHAA